DVAQCALLHPGHLHHCGHPDAHHRHPEHVYLRRAHGGAISGKHRDCLAGPPQATACAAGAQGAMTDHVGTAPTACPAANHIGMAALRFAFGNHVGTDALGCRGDGKRLPRLPQRVEAAAQKTPIGAALGKGTTSQTAERLPFGAVSGKGTTSQAAERLLFGAVSGKGTTSQAAERFPFGVVSARARLRRLRKNTTFREIGKGTTSVVPITLFPSSSRAG